MKLLNKIALLGSSVLLFAASCESDKGHFARENDSISCDCTEQSIEQNVLCDGRWKADCGEVTWVTITPEEGSGNGSDYGFFTVNVEYNSGEARTGVVNLLYDGKSYPIEIVQDACEFAYGEPKVEGTLFQDVASEATITLPYSCASGRESAEISCTITGAAADGISIPTAVYSDFAKGSGALTIPISGTPTRAGAAAFELFVGGVSVGTCRTNVISDPDAVPEGFPVGWNFYALGLTGTGPANTSNNYSWTTGAADVHKVLPTIGSNQNAYLTTNGSVTDNASYTFNPGIQIKGLSENDYFLFVIPVKNVSADCQLSVEASLGGAGSGPGYYALEYSADNKVWKLAAGSEQMTVFGATAAVHYQVPSENAGTDRKTYNKATDKGYHKYTFPLTGIEPIYEGNLYLRLRICMDRRINGSEATNAIGSAWADLKGFEVALVEE